MSTPTDTAPAAPSRSGSTGRAPRFDTPTPNLALVVALVIATGTACFFLFPYDLALLTRIMIMMVFVLSLDLVLGYAGIATLGHAAMYGAGAYAAGLFAIHVSASPLPGLAIGAFAGAAIAALSGLLLMRTHGLTLLMLTIAFAQVLREIANKARDVTGGADGLSGISMAPIAGAFEFDFMGQTGYWYALGVLVFTLIVLGIVVRSPFGLAIRGVRESAPRMRAIGTPVHRRLVTVYALAGAFAGLAGALSAQVFAIVSLESFAFELSAEAVIMLILGGTGRLVGALLGTALFMLVHHVASAVDPFNWLFIIGALVLAVVFVLPRGLVSLLARFRSRQALR